MVFIIKMEGTFLRAFYWTKICIRSLDYLFIYLFYFKRIYLLKNTLFSLLLSERKHIDDKQKLTKSQFWILLISFRRSILSLHSESTAPPCGSTIPVCILTLCSLEVNWSLTVNTWPLSISLLLGSFVRTLWVGFPQARDCRARTNSRSGMSVSCWISWGG